MITAEFIQSAEILFISSDNLKAWWEKAKEKHERMNKVSR